jgi:hypothetical protein
LSFYLMKELARKRQFFPQISQIKIKYVMCDFSTNTINDWLKNEELAKYRQDETLDFAMFKPEEQTEITTYDGLRIAADTVKNPVIAIANYFFDSLRHDAFRVKDHRLEEVLHTFYVDDIEAISSGNPFDSLRKRETYVEITGDYYGDPLLDNVLKSYAPQFDKATILFPVGAFTCLKNLRTMTNNKLVLLSTDKGYTDPHFVEGLWEQPFVSHHGIFSYSVNYDAIAKYFAELGGFSMGSNVLSFSVETQMSVLFDGATPQTMPMTAYHFQENVSRKNPINYLYYAQNLLVTPGTCTKNDMLRTYISFVRTASCDPVALYMCGELIANSVADINGELRRNLMDMLDEVEQNFYHVRARTDALYYLGKIRYMLDDYAGCVRVLQRSMRMFGENSHSLYYLAACAEIKHDYKSALSYYSRSLQLEPTCDVTRRAVERMASKLA